MQSIIYGEEIEFAKPFPNVKQILSKLKKKHDLFLVSHKSKFPYLGKRINLIERANRWLVKNKFTKCKNSIFLSENVFFEKSIKKKIERIKKIKCDIFIDDLKSLLNSLPCAVLKIYFSQNYKAYKKNTKQPYYIFGNWSSLENIIKKYE